MSEGDFDKFVAMLDAAYSLHSKTLAPEAKALFFRAMAEYPLPVVRRAIDAHVKDPRRGQFPPKPADLIAQMSGAGDGRPEADEAWAIAMNASDEAETVIWTTEIAEALGVASPVLEAGDKVGARMAFKEAYSRIVSAARSAGKAVRWSPSLGYDLARRQTVLENAVATGLLPAPSVAGLLPPPAECNATEEGAREGLARLRAALSGLVPVSEKLRLAQEARAAAEREKLARAKSEAADKVQRHQTGRAHA